MYRYTFAIDIENKKVILIEKLTSQNEKINGERLVSSVNNQFFIISCADCSEPQVSVHDYELNYVQSFPMGASGNDTINMAVYAEDRNSMQIWVAKRTSIDLI